MKINLLPSVNPNISTEFAIMLGYAARVWEDMGMGAFIVTSLKDGTHRRGSQHKHDKGENVPGEAADIRTWHHWDDKHGKHYPKLVKLAKRLQSFGFRVVIHPDWISGTPHIHIAKGDDVFRRVK